MNYYSIYSIYNNIIYSSFFSTSGYIIKLDILNPSLSGDLLITPSTINTTHFKLKTDTLLTKIDPSTDGTDIIDNLGWFDENWIDFIQSSWGYTLESSLKSFEALTFYVPYKVTGVQNFTFDCSCLNLEDYITYSLVTPYPFLTFIPRSQNYTQSLRIDFSLVDLSASYFLSISNMIRANYLTLTSDQPFSLVIFKCIDPKCSACLTFDPILSEGICTACATGFDLVNNAC